MTPEERQIIASYAASIYFNTISMIVTVTGFGISALGIFIATRILLYEVSKRLAIFATDTVAIQ
ncbi:hypothetical protein GYMLUDRAFT_240597 [Collybiopsis luxurians FD-317 M1]|nr:hypothetical protein GYMLUDRAFT_240597 [Collybiopsis luxurians FD-317 M1]